ncbi:MAG: hypothetical protein WD772_12835 [Pseudohongiellaceae bacterium]
MDHLYQELKRRKVIRVATVYAVVAWVLIQVASTVFPALQMPDWTLTFVIVIFIFGFPIAVLLSWAYQVTPERAEGGALAQIAGSANTSSDRKFIFATFGLVLLVAGLQVADWITSSDTPAAGASREAARETPASNTRSLLALGQALQQPISFIYHELEFSPDGRQLAYTILDESGVSLNLLELANGNRRALVAQGAPFAPRFSPSGNALLFASIGASALQTIPVAGGRIRNATEVANLAMGAAWLDEQTIVFSHAQESVLHYASINGGDSASLDIPAEQGVRQVHPRKLPNSDWLIYTVMPTGDLYDARIDAFNLVTRESRALIDRGFNANPLPNGFLAFIRDGDLWVARCNPQETRDCLLEAQVEREIIHSRGLGLVSFAVASNGLLVFDQRNGEQSLNGFTPRQFRWHDLAGEDLTHALPQNVYRIRFAPSGESLIFDLRAPDGGTDIAVYSIARRTINRRSFTGEGSGGLWTPDEQRLVYSVSTGNGAGLWITNADGSGEPQLLVSSLTPLRANSFSPDGEHLVFTEGLPDGRRLRELSLTNAERQIINLLPENSTQYEGNISPDGRWIAYVSHELGREEVYVRPYPNINDGKWQITYDGGMDPAWSNDSTALNYLNTSDFSIYRVRLDDTSLFSVSDSEKLSDPITWSIASQQHFAVSPDGSQLIYYPFSNDAFVRTLQPSYVTLVNGWLQQLETLLPESN